MPTIQEHFEETINQLNRALTDYESGDTEVCLEALEYIEGEIETLMEEIGDE
uniref:Uncharacterized protein n=1 Tax=viral metagenome TaxID=1070528 RepID=A0A6M3LYK1_9ZZZZ